MRLRSLILIELVILALAFICIPAFGQSTAFVNITDTGITNDAGDVLHNGLECFTPVRSPTDHTPMSANYPGGTIVKAPKCSAIADGNMVATRLVKSNVTNPLNLCYMRTINDLDTGRVVIGPTDGFACIQPTADTNMNTVVPTTGFVPLILTGPAGHDGADGAAGTPGGVGPSGIGAFRGNYTPGTNYSVGDGVHASDGSTYVNILACTSCSHDPITPSPTYWGLAANAGTRGIDGVPGDGSFSKRLLADLGNTVNLLDTSKVQRGLLNPTTGVFTLHSGDTAYSQVTDFILVYGAASISTSANLGGAFWGNSFSCYDAAFTYLGDTPTTVSPYYNYILVTGTYYVRGTVSSSTDLTGSTITMGTTAAPQSSPFGLLQQAAALAVATAATNAASAIAAVQGATTSAVLKDMHQSQQINRFNVATTIADTYINPSAPGTLLFASGSGFYTSQPMATYPGEVLSTWTISGGIVGAAGVNMRFLDNTGTYIPSTFSSGSGTFTVPSGAYYAQFTVSGGVPVNHMLTSGTIAPAYYYVYGDVGTNQSIVDQKFAAYTPTILVNSSNLKGKGTAWFGDSYLQDHRSDWLPQILAATGAIESFEDSASGRTTAQLFLNYPSASGAHWPDGTGVNAGPQTGPRGTTVNTGTVGHTLAQDLAGYSLIMIESGTNDHLEVDAGNTGTIADAASADPSASLYAHVKNAIAVLDAAAPSIRKIWIGPISNGFGANSLTSANVIQQLCALNGWYYIDMWHTSGINSATWGTDTIDNLHLSVSGANKKYSPLIAYTMRNLATF